MRKLTLNREPLADLTPTDLGRIGTAAAVTPNCTGYYLTIPLLYCLDDRSVACESLVC